MKDFRETTAAIFARYLIPDDVVDQRERKRRRMVAEARQLFLRHGYKKTSIDDVARSSGVSKGTVYLYFESKADLLMHAVIAEKAPMVQPFMEVMEIEDPRERLRAYMAAIVRAVHLLPLSMRFLEPESAFMAAFEELSEDARELVEGHRIEATKLLLGPFVLAQGGTMAELEERSKAFLAVVYSVPAIVLHAEKGGLDPHRTVEVLTNMLVEGFASPFNQQVGV
jgi:AcrR family transcriptional regulator